MVVVVLYSANVFNATDFTATLHRTVIKVVIFMCMLPQVKKKKNPKSDLMYGFLISSLRCNSPTVASS